MKSALSKRHWLAILLAAALLGAAGATPALAQSTGDGFMFRTPRSSLSVRAGYDRAFAGGDLFSFVTSEMTLQRSDFGGATIAADLAGTIGPQLDIVFGVAWSGSRRGSEYRHWWDQDSLPITQTTSLERAPFTASVKWYARPRGRTVGSFAWVPARSTPYVGAGVGAMWSRFHQVGDFIDTNTVNKDIFRDDLSSKSWTFTAHAFAGLEMNVGPRTFVTTEARYTWAKAALGSDFSGFGRIDLSGLSVTAGFGFRM
jgi:hypothetical protein